MSKYYLSGIDWIAQALNRQCRKTPSRNNGFVIAFELEGLIRGDELRKFLKGADAAAKLLTGRTARHKFHLAPYWKCSAGNLNIDVEFSECPPDKDVCLAAADFANRPFRSKYEHLAVRLLARGENSLLLFKFDHLLFDGGGGELFLAALNDAAQFREPDCTLPQLSKWSDKFESGRNVNRFLRDINAGGKRDFFTFHAAHSGVSAANRFRTLHIPAAQAQAFFATGEEKLGPFMDTPFLLALIFGALAEPATGRGALDNDFILLPVTVDLRSGRDRKNRIFFNQWSLAPFSLPIAAASRPDLVVQAMKEQFIELVKSKFLADLDKANLLMRIIPLPLFAKMSSRIFAGTSGSCSFAFLPESGFKAKTFAGRKIRNLLHLPLIPPKPGIGIFINRYNNALNIIISFREGLISETELENLLATLRKAFEPVSG
ncbi:MAG: hypothetical protein PHV82_16875 [Victivallaceae bacterium]|nr:hypothetical protein [Victivallaceae bacterium]